ncbi:hypothetical protein [Streptomyces zaomyceticus]|uniref:hypothetical protein n=1 Tax=Streptomyces zaomyceticus TaxID=68286 RepID=UPI0032524622
MVLYIDTHILDAEDNQPMALKRLWKEGWISLVRSDAMDTELGEAKDPAVWASLTEASATYPESLGVFVLDHSRLDHAVLAGPNDVESMDRLWSLLKPGVDRQNCRKNHTRDVMHVHTAIRYGGHGFVTRDAQMRKKSDQIAAQFSGFQILSPGEALREALARVKGVRALHQAEPQRGDLPMCPTAADAERLDASE